MNAVVIAQFVDIRVSDRKLLTLGSILGLAMRRCVLRKDNVYFPLGPSSITLCWPSKPDKKLANKTQESGALC